MGLEFESNLGQFRFLYTSLPALFLTQFSLPAINCAKEGLTAIISYAYLSMLNANIQLIFTNH